VSSSRISAAVGNLTKEAPLAQDPAYIKEITKLIMQSEPGILNCEPLAVARASASCAEVMGMVLASVLVKKGEAMYIACLKELMIKADKAARATANAAIQEAANPSPETANIN
jgi:hypothetical protein